MREKHTENGNFLETIVSRNLAPDILREIVNNKHVYLVEEINT